MTDIDDQIGHLRTTVQPSPEEMAAAPILDNWVIAKPFETIEREYNAHGTVSGSKVFPDEHRIGTSAIASADYADRWVRTKNTLYRLGFPHRKTPPAMLAAMQPDWVTAWLAVRDDLGQHTVPEWTWSAALATGAAPSDGPVDWPARRQAASAVGDTLARLGRPAIARAWWVLAADASDKYAAENITESLITEIGPEMTPEMSDIIDGWQILSKAGAEIVGEDLSDCVAAARRLGGRRKKRPALHLLVRMAMEPTAITAAKVFLGEARITAATAEAVNIGDMLSERGPTRRAAARDIIAWLNDDGTDEDMRACLRLLALEPFDVAGRRYIADEIEKHLRDAGRDPSTERVARAWRIMASGLAAPFHPEDPVASSWHLDTPQEIAAFKGTDAYRELMADVGAPTADESSGVVVLAKVGGTQESQTAKECIREFKEIVGKRLPFATAPDIARVRSVLRDEFPHATAQIDVLLSGLVEGEPIRMRPVLLVSNPGCGKSRLAVRIAEELRIGLHRFDGAGAGDNAFGGTPRRWSSGEHCVPLEAVRRHRIANPILLVDEIDKCGTSRHNGSLENALMPFLELSTTARAFPDPYVNSDINVSFVNYVLTANSDTVLSGPLRDRLRIIRLPEPSIEHLPAIARSIVNDIAADSAADPRWFPNLEDGELAVAEGLWRGGSVRRLRNIVERILAHRESSPRN